MSIGNFIEQIIQEVRFQIFLCNMVDGVDAGLYQKGLANEVIRKWYDHFQKDTDEPDPVMASLLCVLENYNFRVKLSASDAACKYQYSHAMTAARASNCIDVESCKLLRSDAEMGSGHPSSPYFSDNSKDIKFNGVGTIGKPSTGVVFLGVMEDIKGLLLNNDRVHMIRDKLGLIHWKEGTEYVVLEFGKNQLHHKNCYRPVFIEAASHRRFQTKGRRVAHITDWGVTLDLSLFAKGNDADGAREWVCSSIECNQMIKVTLHPLGDVHNLRGETVKDNDEMFVTYLLGAREISAIKQEIINYCV